MNTPATHIEQNDQVDARGVVTDTANIVGPNSNHVVVADGSVGDSAILDGFFITGGDASGEANPLTLLVTGTKTLTATFVVPDSLSGNVIYIGGIGILNVRVTARSRSGEVGAALVRTEFTDANGFYIFYDLPPVSKRGSGSSCRLWCADGLGPAPVSGA